MKNLLLILGITLITLLLWLGMSTLTKSYETDSAKTLDNVEVISGTIDLEFLQKISNN